VCRQVVVDMIESSNSCIRFLASSAVLVGLGGGLESLSSTAVVLRLRSDSRSFIRSRSASSVNGIGEGDREERSGVEEEFEVEAEESIGSCLRSALR